MEKIPEWHPDTYAYIKKCEDAVFLSEQKNQTQKLNESLTTAVLSKEVKNDRESDSRTELVKQPSSSYDKSPCKSPTKAYASCTPQRSTSEMLRRYCYEEDSSIPVLPVKKHDPSKMRLSKLTQVYLNSADFYIGAAKKK